MRRPACNQKPAFANLNPRVGYQGRCANLPSVNQPFTLGNQGSQQREMLSVTNHETGKCTRWCAVMVLVAVCSLAINVATRYSSAESLFASASKTLHKHTSEQPSRQRLTKNAATWIPPLVVSALFYVPSTYPRVASRGPAVPSANFVPSLYYRPPPSSSSL